MAASTGAPESMQVLALAQRQMCLTATHMHQLDGLLGLCPHLPHRGQKEERNYVDHPLEEGWYKHKAKVFRSRHRKVLKGKITQTATIRFCKIRRQLRSQMNKWAACQIDFYLLLAGQAGVRLIWEWHVSHFAELQDREKNQIRIPT